MSTPLKQIHLAAGFPGVNNTTVWGLDPFVGKVVPLLQERGVFRTEYEGTTLRENLGLAPLGAVKTAQVAS